MGRSAPCRMVDPDRRAHHARADGYPQSYPHCGSKHGGRSAEPEDRAGVCLLPVEGCLMFGALVLFWLLVFVVTTVDTMSFTIAKHMRPVIEKTPLVGCGAAIITIPIGIGVS